MDVFLSSTYCDLSEHRLKASEALDRLGHRVIRMETFGARPDEPDTACLSDVNACEIFIGTYARRYGFIPPHSTTSITELEFDYARSKRKSIFAFVLDRGHAWPEQSVVVEPGRSKL